MPELDPPTLSELYRNQVEFARDMRKRLEDLSIQLNTRVVSQDFYTAAHGAMAERVADLEDNEKRRDAQHAQMSLGILVATIGALGGIVSAVVANLRVH